MSNSSLTTVIARVSDALFLVSSIDYGQDLDQIKTAVKKIVKALDANSPPRCILEYGPKNHFFYQISNDIIFITLVDRMYPKKLGFEFLVELSKDFFFEYGTTCAQSFTRPYAAISFETTLERLRSKFLDQENGHHSLKRLNANLLDIHNIMQVNINDLLSQGESLNSIENTTQRLMSDSYDFKKQAKYTNFITQLKQYAPFVAILVVIVFVLIVRWFL